MSYRGQKIQGEAVRFSLNQTSTSALSGTALVFSDANGATRTIQSYERVILDDAVLDTTTANMTVDIDDPNATNTLIVSLTDDSGLWVSQGEGASISIGTTPTVSVNEAGTIKLNGSGRIINGTTQGVRPNWRESLTPAGDPLG
jgi:hypothetical protein